MMALSARNGDVLHHPNGIIHNRQMLMLKTLVSLNSFRELIKGTIYCKCIYSYNSTLDFNTLVTSIDTFKSIFLHKCPFLVNILASINCC